MHEGPREYPFASAMAKIHEGAAWVIKRVMPRVWVLILLSSLQPLECLEQRLKLNLSIGQTCLLETLCISFPSTLSFAHLPVELSSNPVINLRSTLNVGHVLG